MLQGQRRALEAHEQRSRGCRGLPLPAGRSHRDWGTVRGVSEGRFSAGTQPAGNDLGELPTGREV